MGEVVPFTRRTVEPQQPEEMRPRVASGEVPIITPAERRRLQGSIEGATEADVQRKAVEANPMRMLSRFVCHACDHQWQQPSATGKCPACHSTDVRLVAQIPCMAARV